jgi:DNA polymerase-3 subunit gamma/tau
VLATTEAHKVPATIVDRCHRFDFHRPSLEQIARILERVARDEEIEVPEPAIGMIARAATGSFRDALGTLEQLVTYGGKQIRLEDVLDILGVADAELVLDATDAMAEHDPRAALATAERLSESGRDITQFMRDLSGHLRHVFVIQITGELPDSFAVTAAHPERLGAQAERLSQGEVVRAIELLAGAISAVKEGSEPRIQLELALLKATQPQADVSLQALLFRIEQLENRLGAAEAASGRAPTEPQERRSATGARDGEPPAEGPAAAGAAAAGTPARSGSGQAAAAPALAEAAPQPEPELDLERVRTLWPAVADAVGQANGMVGALLAEARPTELEGSRLTVAFPEDAAFSRKKAESNAELVTGALRGLTGVDLAVRYELGGVPAPERPPILSEEDLIERLREEFGAQEVFDDEE